jgi:hypothetical protein
MSVNGSTSQRGYGYNHQALRRALLPHAYGQPCPKCGETMRPGQPLDLGHNDDRTGYTGMEHASCNRRAGARKRNRFRPRSRQRRSATESGTNSFRRSEAW